MKQLVLKPTSFGCYSAQNNGAWLFLERGFKVFMPKSLILQIVKAME